MTCGVSWFRWKWIQNDYNMMWAMPFALPNSFRYFASLVYLWVSEHIGNNMQNVCVFCACVFLPVLYVVCFVICFIICFGMKISPLFFCDWTTWTECHVSGLLLLLLRMLCFLRFQRCGLWQYSSSPSHDILIWIKLYGYSSCSPLSITIRIRINIDMARLNGGGV